MNPFPGWEPGSWAYHSDDGKSYHNQDFGDPYGPTFTTGDVVGCCVNFDEDIAIFTKNGNLLDVPFSDFMSNTLNNLGQCDIYPTIGLLSRGAHVKVKKPFMFDIMGYISKNSEIYGSPDKYQNL